MKSPNTEAKWQKTNAAGIVRYAPTGILYSRVKVRGKLINRSLKTPRVDVAQVRLNQLVKEERERAASKEAFCAGLMTFGEAASIFKSRLDDDPRLKPRSKEYRLERLAALLKSWDGLEKTDVRRIAKGKCLEWASRFKKQSSATAYNNTVGTLRMVLEIAIEAGATSYNSASVIKKAREVAKSPQLPTNEQFLALVKEVESVNRRFSRPCANLIRFLAFGGFRKGEAKKISWADCDFVKGEITVRGDEETGPKNWTIRRVPMIPAMRTFLEGLRSSRSEEPLSASVMEVAECQGAINHACERLNIPRFTHHDLRHLFGTCCIENGIDIPTISKWMGHKDGGALLMKTYGHLRNQHSTSMAQKVTFGEVAATIPASPVS